MDSCTRAAQVTEGITQHPSSTEHRPSPTWQPAQVPRCPPRAPQVWLPPHVAWAWRIPNRCLCPSTNSSLSPAGGVTAAGSRDSTRGSRTLTPPASPTLPAVLGSLPTVPYKAQTSRFWVNTERKSRQLQRHRSRALRLMAP